MAVTTTSMHTIVKNGCNIYVDSDVNASTACGLIAEAKAHGAHVTINAKKLTPAQIESISSNGGKHVTFIV